jgi:D-beta-D-heptose 7-phosphate kinase/D-beta-D-heptose 1-phosphate adenosyltransferase
MSMADGILTREEMRREVVRLQAEGKKVVFTNGSFDVLHTGHLSYLRFARKQGDCLIVGMNSDASVKGYKDPGRPIVPEADRAAMLAGLKPVDYVVVFGEAEPRDLIAYLQPDVLVKGEDWAHYVSGADIVTARGGKVVLAPLVSGRSTTDIVKKILAAYGPRG